MPEKAVHVKGGSVEARSAGWPVGMPFVYQQSVWRINGMYLTTTRSGEREVWWILSERPNHGLDSDGDGGR